jgi:hypothetical protein
VELEHCSFKDVVRKQEAEIRELEERIAVALRALDWGDWEIMRAALAGENRG